MNLNIFFSFFAILLITIACQTTELAVVFESKELPVHTFAISTDKDTSLRLESGLQFDIPANSIQLKDGTTAHLKIQEALELADMLKADLTTLSDGQLLGSAGMFSFDVEEEGAKITKPIAVSLPAQRLDPAMQLFEGQPDKSGQLNWVNPQALEIKPPSGAELFASQCASCHDISRERLNQQKIPLHYPLKQYRPEWLLDYLRGQEGGSAACCAKDRWNKTVKDSTVNDAFGDVLEEVDYTIDDAIYYDNLDDPENADTTPKLEQWVPEEVACPHKAVDLNDDQLLSILEYIEAESERKVLPVPTYNAVLCQQSCKELTEAYAKLAEQQTRLREAEQTIVTKQGEIQAQKTPEVDATTVDYGSGAFILPADSSFTLPERYTPVSVKKRKASAYKFTIQAEGWYNIDKFLKKGAFDEVTLSVKVLGKFRENVEVFLVVPSEKVFTQATLSGKEDVYIFTNDTKLSMPVGQLAWIYVLGEVDKIFYFESKGFSIKRKNHLRIRLKKSSPEAMDKALKVISQDLALLVEENENYELDQQLFELEADLDKIRQQQQDLLVEQKKIIDRMDKPGSCACACEGVELLKRALFDSMM